MTHTKSNRFGVLWTMIAIVAALPAHATDAERTLTLDSHDLHSIKIYNGAGWLHIQGVDNSDTIEVVGHIVGGGDSRKFTLEKHGDVAVLVANNTERHFVFEWIGERPRIDVTLRVPSKLKLEVHDGADDMTITGMKADAIVADENGDIEIANHHGDLKIYDGAGGIKVTDVTGNIYIQDGADDLSVERVVGNVDINDGIGSIVVKDIDGHVSIHDGRGGIASANITHGLTVNDDSSGHLAMTLSGNKK
jgi:hypothetical protein